MKSFVVIDSDKYVKFCKQNKLDPLNTFHCSNYEQAKRDAFLANGRVIVAEGEEEK